MNLLIGVFVTRPSLAQAPSVVTTVSTSDATSFTVQIPWRRPRKRSLFGSSQRSCTTGHQQLTALCMSNKLMIISITVHNICFTLSQYEYSVLIGTDLLMRSGFALRTPDRIDRIYWSSCVLLLAVDFITSLINQSIRMVYEVCDQSARLDQILAICLVYFDLWQTSLFLSPLQNRNLTKKSL